MFILVESADQEINVEKHSSLKKAQDAMKELYEEHHDEYHLGDIHEYDAYLVPRIQGKGAYAWKIAEV